MKNNRKTHFNSVPSGKGTYLRRAPLAALLILVLFLTEVFFLVRNSSVSASVNNEVAYYKQELEESKDKQNIVMGDIYDRKGNALVTFSDSVAQDQGTYLDPYVYSQTVGYCRNADSYGILGRYESLLRWTADESDTKGCSLFLTLDHDLQEKAYEALTGTIGKNGRGSVVVMNADTGEILSMVSTPVFDASNVSEEMEWMNDSEKSNQVWYPLSRIGNDTAPGSTFKLISAVVMLENGLGDFTTSDDTVYEGKGYTINNYSGYAAAQTIGLQEALRKSSNVYFVKALLDLKGLEEKLTDKAKKLYLGEALSLDFGDISSSWPYDEDTWAAIEKTAGFNAEYERAASLFGQSEIRMSSLQGAMLAAGLINNGDIMTPYMLETVKDSSGRTYDLYDMIDKINQSADFAADSDAANCLKENEQEVTSIGIPEPAAEKGTVLSSLTSSEIAGQMISMMQYAAVHQYGFDESLGVAAKSGTSETGQNAGGGNNAWMVSAAVINGTRYAVCMNWAKAAAGTQGKDMRIPVESIYRYIRDTGL
ncbi:MAG: penicillin-binding transpeptidase domain-containing protein [Lachnospiraceae bacterium]|nr:penicillin-binding transpeptidase domain-containing protein [Lachnospiraceae bacterium]